MTDLLIGSSIAQIEDALEREISFALKRRLPPAATPAALRNLASYSTGSPLRRDLDLVFVTSLGRLFYWSQVSIAADDGTTVIKPADATTGRWIRAESSLLYIGVPTTTITDGILADVVLHIGDFDEQVLKSRIFGKAPCVAIHFDEETTKALSQIPGALYDYRVKFEIWSVSRNFRDRNEANTGSSLPGEFAQDPGVMRIHGAVKQFLAGSNLGIDSITHTEVLRGSLERSDLAERVHVMALEIEVRGSLHNADAPSELVELSRIDAQRYISQVPAGEDLQLDNCVTAGLTVPLGLGLAKVVAAGTATIDDAPVAAIATAHTFSASATTYRDLSPLGAWTFVEVPNGEEVPETAAGSLRVGVTVTDAAGVAADELLCSVFVPSEDPDQIDVS